MNYATKTQHRFRKPEAVHRYYRKALPTLGEQEHATAPDTPGFRRSEALTVDTDVSDYAEGRS